MPGMENGRRPGQGDAEGGPARSETETGAGDGKHAGYAETPEPSIEAATDGGHARDAGESPAAKVEATRRPVATLPGAAPMIEKIIAFSARNAFVVVC